MEPLQKIAGILKTASLSNHLDHLIPICALFDAPILVAEESLLKIANDYYPNPRAALVDHWALEPLLIINKYDLVIHSFFWHEGFLDLWKRMANKKNFRSLYTPHGNSDKGHHSVLMERFAHQDMALLYGDHMKDFLSHKRAYEEMKNPLIMGNVRYRYYLKNKEFFDNIVEKQVFSKFSKNRPIALYAPTWNDEEESSSFFQALDTVCSQLSSKYNLIVKVHPYLLFHLPGRVLPIIEKYQKEGTIQFLVDFPLIYPLLAKTDIYLGDFSSIGYDFLTFDRPLFFFNLTNRHEEDKSCYLQQCGTVIREIEDIDLLETIKRAEKDEAVFQIKRKEMHDYAFSSVNDEDLKNQILARISGDHSE